MNDRVFSSLQVFSRYEKHRQLILEEIFTSLARLPTSKRSLRNFRLANILILLNDIIINNCFMTLWYFITHIWSYLFIRLNSSDVDGEPMYIQMVTALVLQLIQCVVHLPTERDNTDDEYEKKVRERAVNGQLRQSVHICLFGLNIKRLIAEFISRWTRMCSSRTRMKLQWGQRRTFSLFS